MELFVVVASSGEYSSRCEWICGVYIDEAEAKRLVEEHSARADGDQVIYETWHRRKHCLAAELFQRPFWQLSDEQRADLSGRLGPEPHASEADEFWIIRVPLGRWGHYDEYQAKQEAEYA